MTDKNAIITSRAHQNNVFWSRLQTAQAVEGASLAGAYKLWTDEHFFVIIVLLSFSSFLLALLWLLMVRDVQYLNKFETESDFERPPGFISGRFISGLIMFSLIAVNALIFLVAMIRVTSN